MDTSAVIDLIEQLRFTLYLLYLCAGLLTLGCIAVLIASYRRHRALMRLLREAVRDDEPWQ